LSFFDSYLGASGFVNCLNEPSLGDLVDNEFLEL